MVNRKTYLEKGFTIVELLVVVVVMAILATVTIVTYRGIRERAANTAMLSEFQQWKDAFDSYYATFGHFPVMPAGAHYCLGTGFPNGKCRDYLADNENTYTEASSTALMTELNKAPIRVKSTVKYPIRGTVGPYVTFQQNNDYIGLTLVLYGGSDDCPYGTEYIWDDGAGRLLCEYAISIAD